MNIQESGQHKFSGYLHSIALWDWKLAYIFEI